MSQLAAVTPSDTNPLATPVGQLWVGVAGNIALWTNLDGNAGAVTFEAVPAGWFTLPQNLLIAGVKQTGTTATSLLAVAGGSPSLKP